MLHSQGRTSLGSIRSAKTENAFKRFSEVTSQYKSRKLEENSSVCSSPVKSVCLTNVDISNLMVKRGIKTEDIILSMTWSHRKYDEPILQSFVLN